MSEHGALYADAFLSLLRAEGSGNEVTDELFRISRTIEGNDELNQALSNPRLPADKRQQIIEDILGDKALPLTTSKRLEQRVEASKPAPTHLRK